MVKIAYLTQGLFLPEEMEKRQKFLSSLVDEGNEIKLMPGDLKLRAIQSGYDHVLAAPSILKVAMKAEKEGYDALVIGCTGDVAKEAIREACSIPVVGPGITTWTLATLAGDNPTWIGPGDAGMTTLEARQDREKLVKGLIEAAKKKIEEGYDAFAMRCMSCGFQNIDVDLQKELGVPIINNVKAGVKMAELMVDINIPHSKHAFKIPTHSALWPEF
jgi:allantoin racemase